MIDVTNKTILMVDDKVCLQQLKVSYDNFLWTKLQDLLKQKKEENIRKF